MNYIDLLPDDIISYIFDLSYMPYFHAFNSFLKSKYHCDLHVLTKACHVPSITFIFFTYTCKSIDSLFELILLFNFKYKYHFHVKKSLHIINHFLKKII